MNRNEIIELIREAGFGWETGAEMAIWSVTMTELERFVHLIEAKERARCEQSMCKRFTDA